MPLYHSLLALRLAFPDYPYPESHLDRNYFNFNSNWDGTQDSVPLIMRAFCTQQVHSKHFLTSVALLCIRRGTLRTDTGEHFPRTRYSWTVKGVRATRIHTQGWPVIQRACQLPLCEVILLCLCQPYASQWQNGLMAIISQEPIWERLLPTLHLPHLPTKVEKSKQWRTSGLGALRIWLASVSLWSQTTS